MAHKSHTKEDRTKSGGVQRKGQNKTQKKDRGVLKPIIQKPRSINHKTFV